MLLAALLASAGCAARAAHYPRSNPSTSSAPTTSTFVTAIAEATAAPFFAASSHAPSDTTTTFAIIGDYGVGGANEGKVARLVASWHPSYILSTGDGWYPPSGGSGTDKYDNSTGAFYGGWLKDFTTSGTHYPVGTALANAFFPVLGNHDYSDRRGTSSRSYLAYFNLPGNDFTNTSGNERYYDFVQGPIHFFALNSCGREPHGTNARSGQAMWLKRQLAASTSMWNIVYDHHPPYCSARQHGSSENMRWPFKEWGADAVFSGHAHVYERVMHDGIPYIVDGLGGGTRYAFAKPIAGSTVRYSKDWGAEKVTVTETELILEFYNVKGKLIDRYRVPAK
jgi:tartrate-resistant acid phosphatase type 5